MMISGHEEVVKLLIEYGADVNMATQEGWSALDLAMKNGHKKIAEMLKTEENKTQVANQTTYVDLKLGKNLCEQKDFQCFFFVFKFLQFSSK